VGKGLGRQQGFSGYYGLCQDELGDIVFVNLPAVGQEIKVGETLASLESVKSASDVYSPVSGKVVEVNEKLKNSPEIINDDPYGEGWIAVIELSDVSVLDTLMSAENISNSSESNQRKCM